MEALAEASSEMCFETVKHQLAHVIVPCICLSNAAGGEAIVWE